MLDDVVFSSVTPENAAQYAATLNSEDIAPLVSRLDSAEDKIRYPAFLLLWERSRIMDDVYPFGDLLAEKLRGEHSYQRSIGAMLLAVNARYDAANKTREMLPYYLQLLHDPKPITVRQCAQALPNILRAKPELASEIEQAVLAVDLMMYKDTMRKLILIDFLDVLLLVREIQPTPELEEFFFSALSGSILDEKAKKQLKLKLSFEM
jgi:hypothetical protein